MQGCLKQPDGQYLTNTMTELICVKCMRTVCGSGQCGGAGGEVQREAGGAGEQVTPCLLSDLANPW